MHGENRTSTYVLNLKLVAVWAMRPVASRDAGSQDGNGKYLCELHVDLNRAMCSDSVNLRREGFDVCLLCVVTEREILCRVFKSLLYYYRELFALIFPGNNSPQL